MKKEKMAAENMAAQPLVAHLRQLLVNARWALRKTWSTHPGICFGIGSIALMRGLVPAFVILVLRGLVNEAVAQIGSDAPQLAPVLPWLMGGLGLTVLEAILNLSRRYMNLRLSDDLNVRITSDILNHAAKLDVIFFEDPDSQDGLARAQQNTASHFTGFLTNTLDTVSHTVQAVSLIVILVVIEPLLLIALIAFAPAYLRFQWRLAKQRYALEYNRATKRRWTRYFMSMCTSMPSMAEIKLLGLAPLLSQRFSTLMREFRDQDKKIYQRSLRGSALFVALSSVAFYALLLRVILRALAGAATMGDIAVFGGGTARLRNTIETGIRTLSNALGGTLYISNLKTLLETDPSISTGIGIELPRCRGELRVENVSFSYPGTSEPVLHNISLDIPSGETIALVGENGAGKTTLVKLIARLYDPTTGIISLDGHNLRELDPAFLGNEISFVFQNFVRYEATAAENIAYGDWERLADDRKALEEIAQRAGVADMINNMPEGYDTQLGRRFGHYNLSGGQWQRLAVARAFAHRGSILILDEPSSNLDAKAEYEIFCSWRDLAEGRTTIIVSHRFSTVSMANRIIVLDQGRIVETGTHKELLADDGHYARLYGLHQLQKDSAI